MSLWKIESGSSTLCPDTVSQGLVQGGFLTGPPDFQYPNEKTGSANEELFYIENFVKN